MVQNIGKSEVFPPEGIHQKFVLERDNTPDLRFEGFHIATITTKPVQRAIGAVGTTYSGVRSAESGSGRWFEYEIYVAYVGDDRKKYVVEKIGCSAIPGEKKRREVLVFDSGAKLARELGATPEWKAIYRGAHIDIAEDLQ